jgi:hypothetical protein
MLSGHLELELIQARMIQKPLLWVEAGAHAVRKRSECSGVVWALVVLSLDHHHHHLLSLAYVRRLPVVFPHMRSPVIYSNLNSN